MASGATSFVHVFVMRMMGDLVENEIYVGALFARYVPSQRPM